MYLQLFKKLLNYRQLHCTFRKNVIFTMFIGNYIHYVQFHVLEHVMLGK